MVEIGTETNEVASVEVSSDAISIERADAGTITEKISEEPRQIEEQLTPIEPSSNQEEKRDLKKAELKLEKGDSIEILLGTSELATTDFQMQTENMDVDMALPKKNTVS